MLLKGREFAIIDQSFIEFMHFVWLVSRDGRYRPIMFCAYAWTISHGLLYSDLRIALALSYPSTENGRPSIPFLTLILFDQLLYITELRYSCNLCLVDFCLGMLLAFFPAYTVP